MLIYCLLNVNGRLLLISVELGSEPMGRHQSSQQGLTSIHLCSFTPTENLTQWTHMWKSIYLIINSKKTKVSWKSKAMHAHTLMTKTFRLKDRVCKTRHSKVILMTILVHFLSSFNMELLWWLYGSSRRFNWTWKRVSRKRYPSQTGRRSVFYILST